MILIIPGDRRGLDRRSVRAYRSEYQDVAARAEDTSVRQTHSTKAREFGEALGVNDSENH
jgi:hypothetical protein